MTPAATGLLPQSSDCVAGRAAWRAGRLAYTPASRRRRRVAAARTAPRERRLCTGATGATGATGSSVSILRSIPDVYVNPPNDPQTTINNSFVGGSMLFNGTTQYLSAATGPNFIYTLGTNDHTVEFWMYQTVRGAFDTPWSYGGTGQDTNSYYLNVGTGNFYLLLGAGGSSWAFILNGGTLPSLNAWHHYAIVRDGTTFTLYLDGQSVGTPATGISGSITAPVNPMTIGADANAGGQPITGYITNFRYVNGTAVYTSNFTPPTAPLQVVGTTSNTQLLLLSSTLSTATTDTSGNNVTTTLHSSGPVWDALSPYANPAVFTNGNSVIDETLGHLWTYASGIWTDVGQIKGDAGTSGATGATGGAGTSGTSGSSGTSGTSGTSGSSGTSGTSGSSGSSGTSGTSGATGANGTSGSSGTSGTGVPAWTSAGVITLTATTTSPVKGTTTSDNIRYRQVGAKEWEIVLTYIQTVGSVNTGSGDYLITLPNSLSFDTTLPSQQIYTGSVGTSTFALFPYVIPSANGTITNLGVGGQLFPIIYNSTRFRILTITYGTGIQCWGSGFYSIGGDVPKIQLTFSFTST